MRQYMNDESGSSRMLRVHLRKSATLSRRPQCIGRNTTQRHQFMMKRDSVMNTGSSQS